MTYSEARWYCLGRAIENGTDEMSAESEEAKDLTAGVPASAVAEGVMVSGRVGDESVVVTSSAGEYFAFGGTCTHYGGPLAEGLLVGDTGATR